MPVLVSRRPNSFRLILTLAVPLLGAACAHAQTVPALTQEEFQKLHRELQPAEEAWRALPWHTSILEARAQAAKEKKPIYMLVRSGHPLGCV